MRVLGDEWTMMVTHVAFSGATRFDHFMAVLPISRPRLAERLKNLVAVGIFEKRPYQTRPLRHEYVYTEMGRAVHPAAIALIDWAMKWRPAPTDAALRKASKHLPCGGPISGVLKCSSCGEVITPGTIREASPAQCQWTANLETMVARWSKVKNSKLFEIPMDPSMRALKVVGDRWSPIILDRILSGFLRFDALQTELEVSRNILADRLAHLEAEGLLEKRPYQSAPPRYDYIPTEAARDTYPALVLLRVWAQKWRLQKSSDSSLIHLTCGQPTVPVYSCTTCDLPLQSEDTFDPVKDARIRAFQEGRISSIEDLWNVPNCSGSKKKAPIDIGGKAENAGIPGDAAIAKP